MSYQTYFEIGGHVIESYIEGHEGMANRPSNNPLKDLAKETGIPQPLLKSGLKQIEKDTGMKPLKAVEVRGRGRRAQWAFRTAAVLALVDGPVPVGDALAAGLLITYGLYETVQMGIAVKEGFGY